MPPHFTAGGTAMPKKIRLNRHTFVCVWYDKSQRLWFAWYEDTDGNQLGESWQDVDRDSALVVRPVEPTSHY